MANLNETQTWENGIYQIETVDRVVGGPEGTANVQARQLANRTAWLKQEIASANNKADAAIEDLNSLSVTDVNGAAPTDSPALTGTPTAPTAAAQTNTDQVATTAFVRAAISALVDSSPSALDTLNELAAALGDDPNFATTVTNALATKAPMNSPTFTGSALVNGDGLGYAVGSGGVVTQATSKSTSVTLNKASGSITMNSASLSSGSSVSFTLISSKIDVNDVVLVCIRSGATARAYLVQVDAVASGSCQISLRNVSAGPLSEAVVLNFAVIKGAVS